MPHPLQYILLMRHAKHMEGGNGPREKGLQSHIQDISTSLRRLARVPDLEPVAPVGAEAPLDASRVLTSEGKRETRAVAKRLNEHQKDTELREGIELSVIIHARTDEASATAEAMRETLKKQPALHTLAPDSLNPQVAFNSKDNGGTKSAFAISKDVEKVVMGWWNREAPLGNTLLIIGHQPILGWLSHAFTGEAYPIAPSEMLCLDLRKPRGLRWVISPSDDDTLEDLRDKIKSKMTVANLLTGFIAAGLSFLLTTLPDSKKVEYFGDLIWVVIAAAVFLLGAVILFLFTMASYDSLLMPRRFWTEPPSATGQHPRWLVGRPPSPAQWILYQNMIRVWQWQFMPATYLLFTGLILLGYAGMCASLLADTTEQPVLIQFLSSRLPITRASLREFAPYMAGAFGLGILLIFCYKFIRASRGGLRRPASLFRYVCGPWFGFED